MRRIAAAMWALTVAACSTAPAPPTGATIPSFGGGVMLFPPLSDTTMTEFFGCPPEGWTSEKLVALKAAKFEIADAAEREAFAKAITVCLAAPQSGLRDGIAYEALTHMLRGRQLSDDTMRWLLNDLTQKLATPDQMGFGQPFAALALSEVARADRVQAFLTEEELVKLLVDAQHWFINIDDYRAFNEIEGWRHAVAHGADLLMQLALNPRVDAEGLRVIVSAVGVQVAPKGHAYVAGESERLARPILFAAGRGALTEAEWTAWLAALATPKDAEAVYTTTDGLNWRHNTLAFLQTLYVNVVLGSDEADDVMRPGLEAALKAVP